MTTAIIVAAGNSSRMGFDKIFAELCGKPVLLHCLEAFEAAETIDNIIVINNHVELIQSWNIPKLTKVVKGGKDRAESVMAGLKALEALETAVPQNDLIAIHDGARPLITPKLINKVVGVAKSGGAAILAVPVKDTVKIVSNELGLVKSTPDRNALYLAQTPQVFNLEMYRKAITSIVGNFSVTDDSMLFESMGVLVKIAEGDYSNIKITTPEDLDIAETLFERLRIKD